MAKSNFGDCLRFTLKYEGGFSDHPADPGGATNLGITIGVLRSWRGEAVTKADVRSLTLNEAGQIYKARYWDKVEADKLPPGVDLVVFDYAVNSGPARAAKALQRIVGVAVDGIVGDDTIRAVHTRNSKDVITALCDERLRFVKSLRTWKTFGKGWSARISAVRAAALRMASGSDPGDVSAAPAPAKAKTQDKSAGKDPANAAAAAAGAAGAIAPAVEAVKQASEAAEAGKGIMDFVTTAGPWVLLAILIVGFAGYIIWQRRKMAREEGV